MIVNQQTFNSKLTLTDDWGGFYKVVLDLEALINTEDWQIGVSLPDSYQIDQIYGAELTYEGGKTYISGTSWNEDLKTGETTEIILIIDENNQNATPLLPQLFFSEQTSSTLKIDSQIVEDWSGGYKLEINLSAESQQQNWQVDFSFPYSIQEVYGVELIDRGNHNYTIQGQDSWQDLQIGQSIKPILIIDDYGQQAVIPQLIASDNPIVVEGVTEAVDDLVPNESTSSEINEPIQNPAGEGILTQPDGNSKTINVDNDFSGDLAKAIASANDGDVVLLGSRIYYTNGITIEKDITLDGQAGTVINGGGSFNPIINLTQQADGATIQDLEITNGNNGIFGYKVFDLTLQNLNINNIGISQTFRDNQYNTGIVLNGADGLRLINSTVENIGRKAVGINDTDGALISGLTVKKVNLAGQHSQSFDAAGIKFYNTNDVIVRDSYFSEMNAIHIWNDTTNATIIDNNVVERVGEDFLAPSFDDNVNITGIYNEKSSNAVIKNNRGTSIDGFLAFNATEFSTETMTLENNDFSSMQINTRDYWVNEPVEKLIATTEDPDAANFSMFADEYFAQAEIG